MKFLSVFLFSLFLLTACNWGAEMSEEEKVFNESGRAKAIENPADLFPVGKDFDVSLLEGKWQSTHDNEYTIEFKGDSKIDYYEGLKMSSENLRMTGGELTLWSEEGMEHRVIDLTENSLSLMHVYRGNILEFERIE